MSNSSQSLSPSKAGASPLPPTASTSVDNALALLQLIGERQALRVAEAADLLGVARSTAHRLLAALRRRGFVTQDRPNGAYRPGPTLYQIGINAANRIDVRRVARPVLEQVRDATRETVSLAVLEGATVRFVECVESPRSVRVGNRTGVVRPAHASAVGKAILASVSGAELARRYPQGVLPAVATAAALTDFAVLQADLELIRTRGYAINWEESVDGVCAVGVALRDIVGQPRAALAIAVPRSRLADQEALATYAPLLTEAIELIDARLREPGEA